jgi:outer membrane protein assembly factor BamE (lipoprotein component of BamABCDE complex)
MQQICQSINSQYFGCEVWDYLFTFVRGLTKSWVNPRLVVKRENNCTFCENVRKSSINLFGLWESGLCYHTYKVSKQTNPESRHMIESQWVGTLNERKESQC